MEPNKKLTKMPEEMLNVFKKNNPLRPWSPGVCLWTLVKDYHGNDNRWNTVCGESIVIGDEEAFTKFKTCPFCSREIKKG